MFLINLLKIKIIFKKPSKNKILLYDGVSINHMNLLTKKFSVFYNRYEEINLYVLFHTILKNGFKEIKKNYKINFFKFVSPQLIITFIDSNLSFYNLKNLYKDSKYMSVECLTKVDSFYNRLKNKANKKIFSDYKFFLGRNSLNNSKKYFKGKFIINGSIYNNKFYIKKKNKIIEKKNFNSRNILFISSYKLTNLKSDLESNHSWKEGLASDHQWIEYANHFIKIFNLVCEISKFNNYNLFFLSKDSKMHETNFRKFFATDNWTYIPNNKNFTTSYEHLNNAHLVISDFSTLAYESLAKKKRTIFIPSKKYLNNNCNDSLLHKSSISLNNPTYASLSSLINELYNMTDSKWNKKIKAYFDSSIAYDRDNSILKKHLKSYLIN
jgi:surface carbohydrate biosynthesis protein